MEPSDSVDNNMSDFGQGDEYELARTISTKELTVSTYWAFTMHPALLDFPYITSLTRTNLRVVIISIL